MKTRIIAAVAAILMLFSLVSVSAVASDTDGSLSFSPVGSVSAGSTFVLTMTLDGLNDDILTTGISGLEFVLKYNHSLIETSTDTIYVTGINNDNDNWEIVGIVSSSNCKVFICNIDGTPVAQNGVLTVSFEFTVSEAAAGKDVTVDLVNVAITDDDTNYYEIEGDTATFSVAAAGPVTTTVNGIEFIVNSASATASVLSVADKSVTDLVIPSAISYNGSSLKVNRIEDEAFLDLASLKSVEIPCSVVYLSSTAFPANALTIKGCPQSSAYGVAHGAGMSWEVNTERYELKTVKESTCTEHGYTQLVCPDCGEGYGDKTELPILDHSYGDWIVTKEPTDDVDGSRERTCSVCGTKDTEIIPRLNCPHENTEEVITKEPTCSEAGSKDIVCTLCNHVVESNVEIPKTEHTFGDWVVTKEATVKETGSREHTCSVCGITETETIPKLTCSHTNTTNSTKEPTCTEYGYSSTICRDCGVLVSYTKIEAKHTEGPTETKDPTCTVDGYIMQQCTKCGEILRNEIIPATGHEYGEWEVIVEPTTEAEGKKMHTCTKCEKVELEAIPMLQPVESVPDESVPELESSAEEESSFVYIPTSSSGSGGGSNKTAFFIIGLIVVLLTIGYIVVMAINKRRNY